MSDEAKKEHDDFWDQLYNTATPAIPPSKEEVEKDAENLEAFVESTAEEIAANDARIEQSKKKGRPKGARNKKVEEPEKVVEVFDAAGADSVRFPQAVEADNTQVPTISAENLALSPEQVESFLMASWDLFKPYLAEFLKKNRQ